MAEKISENYFTIGEFAGLFGVSKQTLFYYERNKILIPALIEENGHRYYALEQYFIFDIIINLRKLGVPLKKITSYIQNRNIDDLQNLFSSKQNEYKLQIDIMSRNILNLQTKINRLEKVKKIKTDRITLEEHEKEYIVVSKFTDLNSSMKEKIKLVAKHNYPFAVSEILNEYLMGYILPYEKLKAGLLSDITSIFTTVSHPDEYNDVKIKPEGLYASIFTPNGYHVNYKHTIKKLFDFIELNSLEIVGDLYIEQLRNYWSTESSQQYVTKIMIPVDYK